MYGSVIPGPTAVTIEVELTFLPLSQGAEFQQKVRKVSSLRGVTENCQVWLHQEGSRQKDIRAGIGQGRGRNLSIKQQREGNQNCFSFSG